MRSRKTSKKSDEKVETVSSDPVEEFGPADVTGRDGVVQAPKAAPKRTAEEEAKLPKARSFRVLRGGMVSSNGHRTTLRVGKVIQDTSYNIDQLKQQGVELEELTG